MKSALKYLFVLLTLPFIAGAQVPLAKVNNQAFGPSEVLEYRVHYGFMDAGTARLEVDPIVKNLGGRTCYRVLGTGRSVGAFDWFFKVRDHYESYIDAEAMVPWLFIRKIEEGSYKKNQNVSFNHFKSTATSEKKTIKTPGQVQDLISAFYYARTLDFEHAAVGDTFLINCYLDDETFRWSLNTQVRKKLKPSWELFVVSSLNLISSKVASLKKKKG